jgi:hypothetical protein
MTQRRGLLWLVLLALVAAQTLGLMHRAFHHAGADYPVLRISQHAVQQDQVAGTQGWIASLFSSHDDSSCPLYDQLGQGGMITMPPAIALPLAPTAFVLQWFQGEVLARWAALFDARGPPSIR